MDTGHGTTITKTESRGRPHDADFTEYVAARQGQMLRFAYLLTGQRAEAEDLLQTAFAKLYLAWGKVDVESSRDAYVRTILVRENASTWRRLWRRREQSVGELTDGSAVDAGFVSSPHESFVDRSLMWQCVCALPPKQGAPSSSATTRTSPRRRPQRSSVSQSAPSSPRAALRSARCEPASPPRKEARDERNREQRPAVGAGPGHGSA